MNWGVNVAGYAMLAWGDADDHRPTVDGAVVTGRVGRLFDPPHERWWWIADGEVGRLRPQRDESGLAEVASEVRADIEGFLLPFLLRVTTVEDVVALVRREGDRGITTNVVATSSPLELLAELAQ